MTESIPMSQTPTRMRTAKKIGLGVLAALGSVIAISIIAILIVLVTHRPLFRGFITDIWLPWSPWWPQTLIIGDRQVIKKWDVKNYEAAREYPAPSGPALQIFTAQVTLLTPELMTMRVVREPGKNIAVEASRAKFGIYDPLKKGPKSLAPFTAETLKYLKVGQIVYIEGRQTMPEYDGIQASLVLVQEE